jgi:endonuclease/exonuclease/phosphatase family metal-dependent hydrolase
MIHLLKRKRIFYSIKARMGKILKKIVRFSTFFKIATLICLGGLLLAYLAPFVHPNTLKIIPFFGLAYPVILLLTIIFLLIWILLRSRWAILVGIVLLIGGKLHFRMIATGSDPEHYPKDNDCLKVMSYNVRLFGLYTFQEEERKKNRNAIFSYIEKLNPDVACFQEFYHQDKPTSFSTRDTLMEMIGFKEYHERYAHKLRGRQNFGIAILSKFPVIAKGDIMFHTQSENDFNYCIYIDILKDKDTFRIYNVHLQSIKLKQEDYSMFEDHEQIAGQSTSTLRLLIDKLRLAYPKRAEQARKVAEHVATCPYPSVVCGDFNDTPLSYTYNQFNSILNDAFRNTRFGIGSTYVGKIPAGRIDYIFYSDELQAARFRIQRQAHSDHRAISCEIFRNVND